jgi:hypothetical protein
VFTVEIDCFYPGSPSCWHWFGGARVRLASAAYRIALDVGLSETCFLCIHLGELDSNLLGNTMQSMSQASKMNQIWVKFSKQLQLSAYMP